MNTEPTARASQRVRPRKLEDGNHYGICALVTSGGSLREAASVAPEPFTDGTNHLCTNFDALARVAASKIANIMDRPRAEITVFYRVGGLAHAPKVTNFERKNRVARVRPKIPAAANFATPAKGFVHHPRRNRVNIASLPVTNLPPANDLPRRGEAKSLRFRLTRKKKKIK